MRCYRAKDAPIRPLDIVFRESRLRMACFSLAMLLMAVVPLVMGLYSREWIAWLVCGPVSVFSGLIGLLVWSSFIHTFHQGNWLIRYNPRSLLINLRTFDNDAFNEEDEVVVEFQPGEIEWIRKTAEKRLVSSSENGTQREYTAYLDIKPKTVDLAPIHERLKAESQRSAPPWRGKNNFVPVRIVEEEGQSLLRIEWRSNWTSIRPKIDEVISALSSGIGIQGEQRRELDLSASTTDRDEQESRILGLIERGQILQAITLVRQFYGYSLSEARRFVEELQGK